MPSWLSETEGFFSLGASRMPSGRRRRPWPLVPVESPLEAALRSPRSGAPRIAVRTENQAGEANQLVPAVLEEEAPASSLNWPDCARPDARSVTIRPGEAA